MKTFARELSRLAAAAAAILFVAALGAPAARAQERIKVTATVGMVADLVKNVGGDRVAVQGLMGPGVDPHLYKPTPSDLNRLQGADVIFYVGLLLEGKMQDTFAKLARRKKYVYAITESLPENELLEPPEFAGHFDPHIWFDVPLWSKCADAVAAGLGEFEPKSKSYFEQHAKAYQKKLADMHAWALGRAGEIPKEKRILITSHDAFNYFGRAYDFQVVGLQGISTVTEAGLADMTKMVEFIKGRKIGAIFVESSVPHNTIERISQDAKVKIGGELFSDAMGAPGEMEKGYDLGTYEGMIKHNINTVVEALK